MPRLLGPSPRKPKVQQPFTVTVGGRKHLVIGMTKDCWVEREESGRRVFHMGRLLINGQEQTYWDPEARPCTRCKLPSHYTTKPRGTLRGRPVHPMCEGALDILPDNLAAQVIFGVAVDLNAQILTEAR